MGLKQPFKFLNHFKLVRPWVNGRKVLRKRSWYAHVGNQMIFSPYVADVLLIIFLMYVKSESSTLSRTCIKLVAGFKIAGQRPSWKWGKPTSLRVFCSCLYEIELYSDIYDFSYDYHDKASMFSHFTSTLAADIVRTSVRDNANEIEVVFMDRK